MPEINIKIIEKNFDLLNPLVESRREINKIRRYKISQNKELVALEDSFYNLMRDIEIKILHIYGLNEANKQNFYKYELDLMKIIELFRYIQWLKEI